MLFSVETHSKVDIVVFKDIHFLIVSSRMQEVCHGGLLFFDYCSPERGSMYIAFDLLVFERLCIPDTVTSI